mgnify:CR=1 FL=1
MPVGSVITWPSSNLPEWMTHGDYLECNGQAFDTTKYPRLYKALGDNHVPDYRGLFLRGSGTYDGKHGSGGIGSVQGDATLEYKTATVGLYGAPILGGGWPFSFRSKYSTSELPGIPESITGYPYGWSQSFRILGSYHYRQYPDKPYRYKYRLVSSGGGKDKNGNSLPVSYSLEETKETMPDFGEYDQVTIMYSNRMNAPIADEIRPINTAVRYFIKAR